MPKPILQIVDLYKNFGGVVATDHLSLNIERDEVHAIIGPNGAGKTTLVNQLSGEYMPDAGSIIFDDIDITARGVADRVSLGICRSYQITSIFPDFSALANVSLAVQARRGHSYHFWKPVQMDPTLNGPALEMLNKVGLVNKAQVRAAELSYGEKRALEIAMVLGSEPRVLLLDEPMAGMGVEESASTIRLILSLKGLHTIILVEHDMDAIFALADRVTVLVYGRPIATGSIEEIKANRVVREAYLGDYWKNA